MKKAIFAIGVVVALASCGGQNSTQEEATTDTTAVSKVDTTAGTVIDSTKVDSVSSVK